MKSSIHACKNRNHWFTHNINFDAADSGIGKSLQNLLTSTEGLSKPGETSTIVFDECAPPNHASEEGNANTYP